ncbi:MAG: Rpn family recombination-promoting nuclease/putative transposase [Treponema sp.]|nr:Rpn family recombination-promoting nuclease/putative transposase [Treponema sp.]
MHYPISSIQPDDDPLDIRMDNVFKAVFTKDTPESAEALSRLVSALIGRDVTIVSILANEPPVDNVRDRQIRFDINCKAENGELINVEMSLNPGVFEPIRLEYYTSRLFGGQDVRGSDSSYKDLKQTYQITILANKKFFTDDAHYHAFEYYDPIRKVSLDGKTRIITLELSKVDIIAEKPIDEMTVSERWAVFLEYLTDRNKRSTINAILEQEGGIAMANQVLMTISRDEHERARLESEFKYQMDMQSQLVTARREGKLEGKIEGKLERDKELMENARNALAEGIPIAHIQKITGLDMETIEQL